MYLHSQQQLLSIHTYVPAGNKGENITRDGLE